VKLWASSTLPARDTGVGADPTAGADEFVLSTLAFLFFVLGIGAAGAWILWRRQTFPKPHRRLLMELEAERDKPVTAQPPAEDHPWERQPDWWKKPD
jgi:hypothetical protein